MYTVKRITSRTAMSRRFITCNMARWRRSSERQLSLSCWFSAQRWRAWGRPVPPRAPNALSRKFVVWSAILHKKSAKSLVKSWLTATRHWTKHAFSWMGTVSALRLSLVTSFVQRLQTVRVRTPTVIKRAKTLLRFLQKALGQKNFH